MRRFGLIGRTLKHSFSKGYFTDKFLQEQRTNCVYENFELDTIGAFPFLLERYPDLAGLNVTIPYKKEIVSFLNEQDDAVTAIGACNCVRFRDGRLEGFNTDVIGFARSLAPLLQPHHRNALVLGTGGASAAVLYALKELQLEPQIVSRTAENGALAYHDLSPEIMQQYAIIVNTTPLGTWPEVDAKPDLPYEGISPQHLLYDLVYNPAETAFLKEGKARGAQVKNGHEMLVLQAEAAWKIWNEGL